MKNSQIKDLLQIRAALEASWDEKTSYLGVKEKGNPALGQCYPTAWVIQHFFPKTEIVKGTVWTGISTEIHFWNVIEVDGELYHVDLSWQQFPPQSTVRDFEILDRHTLNDSESTQQRCATLLERVNLFLKNNSNFAN